jgi:hypothetical protein
MIFSILQIEREINILFLFIVFKNENKRILKEMKKRAKKINRNRNRTKQIMLHKIM